MTTVTKQPHSHLIIRFSVSLYILLTTLSCGNITPTSNQFISSSGVGEIIISNQTSISIERMALIVKESLQELHLMGDNCTMNSDGEILGKGTSIIATIIANQGSTLLEAGSYTNNNIEGVCYTTLFDDSIAQNNYTEMVTTSIIIRESQSAYDIKALCVDMDGNSVILSFTGYLLRTIIE